MLVIALTGGIGSGKSTVANCFCELGITIIDADKIAQELVEPNNFAYLKIIQHFGKQVIAKNSQLNRNKLRQIIFSNAHEKSWLESLLHPLIRERIQQQLTKVTSPYCIIEIPLLTTDKSFSYIDRILVVDCDESTQITRAQQRDKLSSNQIKKIIKSQPTRKYRLDIADDVLDNSANLSKLQAEVKHLHAYYLKLSEAFSRLREKL